MLKETKTDFAINRPTLNITKGASLVAQWLGIRLPMKEIGRAHV